ncbi:EamA family transporter [Brevundimonas sp. LM2]|uniref:DMT family transporter n=1 Tax=Brevundimonas sp. LM2 TaxID=1938605 RepID=UPI000983CB4F|nr:DMT family transporter [Brevundimonas sp. LM2]AQR63396.1 EamA family transporter [Brevundimonas sp. LM2]
MSAIPDKPHSPLTLLEIGAIVAIVVIWGANNAAAKVATEVLPPLMTGAVRFAIAALCLIPFVRPPFPNWKSLAIIVILGGPLHYGLIYLAFWLAQDVGPVSVATQLWIPFTALFAFMLLGERLTRFSIAGLVLALAGVAWMSLDAHAVQDWKAIALGVAASACWGMTTVIARRTTSIPPLKMQGLLALFALPTLAAGSAFTETGQVEAIQEATPLIWACLLWAGVISSVIATSLMFWLVQKRQAGRVTPYFLATPVVSMAIGWGWMGDVLTPQILAGSALTMGGVAVVALAERGLRAGAAKA